MTTQSHAIDSHAFDAFADTYDDGFTNTTLGRMLRNRVWDVLSSNVTAGDRLLELACGTGEDAVFLAGNGVDVVATDGSAEMLDVTRHKAQTLPVETMQLSLQQIIAGKLPMGQQFDALLSNFGGLNTISIDQLKELAAALAPQLKSGGRLILVPMGPYCPIESLWYALHGQPRLAIRRWRQPASAQIGDRVIPIWYPSARSLEAAFGDWFRPISTQSLGLWLPPSYLSHLVDRFPRLWQPLAALEQRTARWTRGLGDHYITVLERL